MVYLTITPAVLEAIEYLDRRDSDLQWNDGKEQLSQTRPRVGLPISHVKILDISTRIRTLAADESETLMQHIPFHRVDDLLRGSRVYIEPPKTRAEPTSEYKALMARLRREEENRAYERMISTSTSTDPSVKGLYQPQHAHLFSSSQADISEDEEISYADVNRQMALIANVLLSILACSVAIWVAARYWSTPARLALSMGGSTLVGVAEVVVYSAYIGRLREARAKGKKSVEIKKILKTWVIGGDEELRGDGEPVAIVPKASGNGTIRRKNKKPM